MNFSTLKLQGKTGKNSTNAKYEAGTMRKCVKGAQSTREEVEISNRS